MARGCWAIMKDLVRVVENGGGKKLLLPNGMVTVRGHRMLAFGPIWPADLNIQLVAGASRNGERPGRRTKISATGIDFKFSGRFIFDRTADASANGFGILSFADQVKHAGLGWTFSRAK